MKRFRRNNRCPFAPGVISRHHREWHRLIQLVEPDELRDLVASVVWWDLAGVRPDVAEVLDPYRRAYAAAEAARVERGDPEVPADLDALRAALVVLGYRADMVADRARIRWTYAGEAGRNGPAFHRSPGARRGAVTWCGTGAAGAVPVWKGYG